MLFKSSVVLLAAWSLVVLADNAQLRTRQQPRNNPSDNCFDVCDSQGMASLKACLINECDSNLDPSTPPPSPDTAQPTMNDCEYRCFEMNNYSIGQCYDNCMKNPSQPNPSA